MAWLSILLVASLILLGLWILVALDAFGGGGRSNSQLSSTTLRLLLAVSLLTIGAVVYQALKESA